MKIVTSHRGRVAGAGGRDSVNKWHMVEGGSKIGQKSVTYYLNGPYMVNLNDKNILRGSLFHS